MSETEAIDPSDFFHRFVEVWETGRVDDVDDLLPEGSVYHLAGFPDMDRDGVKQFVAAFHRTFPDFRLTLDELIDDGDRTAYRWSCGATFTGEGGLLPMPPTGGRPRRPAPMSCTGGGAERPRSGTSATGWAGCRRPA